MGDRALRRRHAHLVRRWVRRLLHGLVHRVPVHVDADLLHGLVDNRRSAGTAVRHLMLWTWLLRRRHLLLRIRAVWQLLWDLLMHLLRCLLRCLLGHLLGSLLGHLRRHLRLAMRSRVPMLVRVRARRWARQWWRLHRVLHGRRLHARLRLHTELTQNLLLKDRDSKAAILLAVDHAVERTLRPLHADHPVLQLVVLDVPMPKSANARLKR